MVRKQDKQEDWINRKWRPMMAVTYMVTIWFDFVIGPILYNMLQYMHNGQAVTPYQPITLQGGGLYHIAMGTVLGVAAYTRGKEKIAMIESSNVPQSYTPPSDPMPQNPMPYDDPTTVRTTPIRKTT